MKLQNSLNRIQTEMKAPKNMFNKFGNYKYRTFEGICEAIKPYLKEEGCVLTITDDIICVGENTPTVVRDIEKVTTTNKDGVITHKESDKATTVVGKQRIYVKAIARLQKGEECIEVSAIARESEQKKGMDDSQITGTASSYARKYALNGLFLLDDTKDSDVTNVHGGVSAKKITKPMLNTLKKELERTGLSEYQVFKTYGKTSLEDLDVIEFTDAMEKFKDVASKA